MKGGFIPLSAGHKQKQHVHTGSTHIDPQKNTHTQTQIQTLKNTHTRARNNRGSRVNDPPEQTLDPPNQNLGGHHDPSKFSYPVWIFITCSHITQFGCFVVRVSLPPTLLKDICLMYYIIKCVTNQNQFKSFCFTIKITISPKECVRQLN